MSEHATPPAGNLTTRVIGGLRWGAVDVVLQQLMRLAVTVVLTRLLAPSEFGLLAMALVFTQLATFIGDLGLGPALVQRRDITRAHIVTAFTVTTGAGLAFALIMFALSWPVAAFYDRPDLQPVLAVLSVSYLIRGIAGAPRDLLRRDMRFSTFAATSSTAIVVGGIAGIAMALLGYGVWALVGQVLVESVVAAVLVLYFARRAGVWSPGVGVDRSALRDLVGFGAFVSGTRLMHYGATNIDNLIVGKVLGPASLGLYNLAYRLMLFPVLRVADVVANVAMPAMASVQDDRERVARAFRKAVRTVGLVCFPVSIGTAILAPELIPALFGAPWSAAVPVVQILALNGVRLALGRLHGAVHEATGRPSRDFAMVTLTFLGYLVGFLVGVRWGIEGVAWAYTIVGYALMPVDQWLVHRSLGVRMPKLITGLLPIALSTAVMALAVWGVMTVADGHLGSIATSVLGVGVGAVVYLGAVAVTAPDALDDLRGVAR